VLKVNKSIKILTTEIIKKIVLKRHKKVLNHKLNQAKTFMTKNCKNLKMNLNRKPKPINRYRSSLTINNHFPQTTKERHTS
jgi:hypothetical protein